MATVTITHANNSTTGYNAATNTDASRWAAVKTAIAALVAGDKKLTLAAGNYYNGGDGTYYDYIVLPSSFTFEGAGYDTKIYSDRIAPALSTYPGGGSGTWIPGILVPHGSSQVIQNLRFAMSAASPSADFYRIPIGYNDDGATLASTTCTISNIQFDNCETDLLFFNSGSTGNSITVNGLYGTGYWDGVSFSCPSSTLTLTNSYISVNGDIAHGSGTGEARCIQQGNGSTIAIYNTSLYGTANAVGDFSACVYSAFNDGVGGARLFSCRVQRSGSLLYSLHSDTGGIIAKDTNTTVSGATHGTILDIAAADNPMPLTDNNFTDSASDEDWNHAAAWDAGHLPTTGERAVSDTFVGVVLSNSGTAHSVGGLSVTFHGDDLTGSTMDLSTITVLGAATFSGVQLIDDVKLADVQGALSGDVSKLTLTAFNGTTTIKSSGGLAVTTFTITGTGTGTITVQRNQTIRVGSNWTGTVTGASGVTVNFGGDALNSGITLNPNGGTFTNYTGGPVAATPNQNRLSLGLPSLSL